MDHPTVATLQVFTQPKPAMTGLFGFRSAQVQETLVGQQDFEVTMRPKEKQLHYVTLARSPSCQVLVISGTFVSCGAQVLLDNKCVYAGYLTVYIRGRSTPVSKKKRLASQNDTCVYNTAVYI